VLPLTEDDIATAQVTTRDIDRGDAPHFLLKEIGESPESLRKTLRGKIVEVGGRLRASVGDRALPPAVVARLADGTITKVRVIGQGTAAVAGRSMAALLDSLVDGRIDVDPVTAMPMLERTLGAIPAGTNPGPVVTEEPPQRAEKRIVMEDPSQPILFMGFHRGDVNAPDYAVYEALSELLAGGRSSRLYTSLVKEKKIALAAGSMSDIGQKKYPGLFLFYAVPNKGNTNAECEAAIDEEIARLQREPASAAELEGVKARSKANFLRSVDSNMGLAMQLASAENLEGDWREAFRWLDRIDTVTAADIMRVATATFTRSNRTVGLIETATAPTAAAAAP
jgi:hypothetical protein